MRLSGSTNAHGALATQSDFPSPNNWVLCCQETGIGDSQCSSTLDPDTNQPVNKLLGLSSATNAHAEIPDFVSPSYNNYNVCYGSLVNCSSVLTQNRVEVIDLSSDTNAHLSDLGVYSTKIFCAVAAPPATCTLTSASWSQTEILNGTAVSINVIGSQGCSTGNPQVSIAISRDGTDITTITADFASGATTTTGTWNDPNPPSDTNYTFIVTGPSNSVPSENELHIIQTPSWCSLPETQLISCGSYTSHGESDCTATDVGSCQEFISDPTAFLQASVPSHIDCSEPGSNCRCVWDSSNSECTGTGIEPPRCGNSRVEAGESCDMGSQNGVAGSGCSATCGIEPPPVNCNNNNQIDAGEYCDGTDRGGETCQSFGYSGGTLSCTNCGFNRDLCTNNGPYCGDNIINPGEQCDSINFGDIVSCAQFGLTDGTGLSCTNNCEINTSAPYCTGPAGPCGNNVINPGETCDGTTFSQYSDSCTELDDFTSGDIACDNSCQIDTLDCNGGPGDLASTGTCFYGVDTSDTCEDDGYLTVTWTTRWQWSGTPDTNNPLYNQCQADNGVQDTVACPAQIPLPFFNLYNLFAAVAIIAIIYIAMHARKARKK